MESPNGTQRQLETVYASSAQELESLYLKAEGEAARVQDLVQLLKATQMDGGASVQPAEVAIASDVLEALASAPRLAAAATAGASSESGPGTRHLPNAAPEVVPEVSPDIPLAGVRPEQADRRSEPRVNAVQLVKVAALRDLEREMNCALVNTSDSGIQFTSDTDFAIGEILVAELAGQLALAEVRHSLAKDARYTIGTERVQTISKDGAPSTSSGTERAELLIKALCDRVGTGFADEPGQEVTQPGSGQRERGLERVARILEIWERVKTADLPAVPAEPVPSIGGGRTFAAVGLSLVIVALLMVCIVEYRKNQAIPPVPEPKKIEAQAPAPAVATPAVATPAPVDRLAPVVPIVHRAQVRALQPTWVSISTDGHKIFGATIPKGSTQDLEYSKIAFLHAGNAAGIEVTVDGQTVPMGAKPSLRLVELNTTGYRFLRWSNDDPPDVTPSSKHD
jgi:Domain of unknown function (DUF4115)